MEPELALGLPAAGALAAAALRQRRPLCYLTGGLLGLAGLAAALITLPDGMAAPLRLSLNFSQPSQALFLAGAACAAAVIAFAPRWVDRSALMVTGLGGVAGLAALGAASDVILLSLALLAIAIAQGALPGRRPLAMRVQGPALAAVLLVAGYALAAAPASTGPARLVGLALALGLVAAIGLFPFLQAMDPEEPMSASPVVWHGFFGPVIAMGFTQRAVSLLAADGAEVFGVVLVALGLLNLIGGSLAAWWTAEHVAGWRYSFLAEWGLALVGLGLLQSDGRQAAFLLVLSILLVRFPLFLWARPVIVGRERPATGPLNVVLIALLAGVAPFAGFGARLLLLKATAQVAWPLAAVLVMAMLLWVGHSLRLARTLGRPRGRAAIGTWLAIGASLVIGLLPGPLLSAAGL